MSKSYAQELYELASSRKEREKIELYEVLCKRTRNAANAGAFSYDYYLLYDCSDDIIDYSIELLMKEGLKVTKYSSTNDPKTTITISWENTNE